MREPAFERTSTVPWEREQSYNSAHPRDAGPLAIPTYRFNALASDSSSTRASPRPELPRAPSEPRDSVDAMPETVSAQFHLFDRASRAQPCFWKAVKHACTHMLAQQHESRVVLAIGRVVF